MTPRLVFRLMLPLLVAACCLAKPVRAQDAASAEPVQFQFQAIADIRAAAASYVGTQVPATARVDTAALDPHTRMAACAHPLMTTPASRPVNGQWNIAVSCTRPRNWTLYVPVRVSERQNVLVLKRNLRAGDTLTADALGVESRDVAGLTYGYMTDPAQVAGKVVRRPVGMGTPLTPDMLGAALSIRRGQSVTLLGRAGLFEVRAEGKALSDGGSGDRISVENSSSKRVVEGTVLTDGTVQITL